MDRRIHRSAMVAAVETIETRCTVDNNTRTKHVTRSIYNPCKDYKNKQFSPDLGSSVTVLKPHCPLPRSFRILDALNTSTVARQTKLEAIYGGSSDNGGGPPDERQPDERCVQHVPCYFTAFRRDRLTTEELEDRCSSGGERARDNS